MRVYSHSYWLVIFCKTNSSRVLARERRWQINTLYNIWGFNGYGYGPVAINTELNIARSLPIDGYVTTSLLEFGPSHRKHWSHMLILPWVIVGLKCLTVFFFFLGWRVRAGQLSALAPFLTLSDLGEIVPALPQIETCVKSSFSYYSSREVSISDRAFYTLADIDSIFFQISHYWFLYRANNF